MTINLIGKQNDKREGKYSAKQNNTTRQAQCLVRPWGGGPPVLNFFWKDGLTDGLARKEPHQTNLTFKPRQQILSTNLPQSVVVPNTCQKLMEPWSLEKLTRNNFEWIFWMFDWKCIEKNNIFELVHCARQRNFKSQVAGHFLTYQNYPTAPDGRVNIGWILCEFLASAFDFESILAWFGGGNFGSKIWRVNFEWISAWISREFWVNFEWIFSK